MSSVYWSTQQQRNKELLETYAKHKMTPTIHNGRLLEPYLYAIGTREYLGNINSSIDKFEIWKNANPNTYRDLIEKGDLK